jgi:3-hydroxyisobutyrate dehydrogenase
MPDTTGPSPATPTLGVVGLGSMGLGAALSALRAGIPTWGCDLRPGPREALAAAGGHAVAAPADLAAHCDVVMLLVVNAAQTEDVLFGAGGLAQGLRRGAVVIASATVDPALPPRWEDRLAEHGLWLLDAPVSGGAKKAAEGQMTIMASGCDQAFAAAGPVLDAVAATVYRLGDRAGAGSTVKMINQHLAGVHIAAACEAMALGLRAGADPAQLYEVITHSAGNSWMFANRVPHILAGDYRPLSAVNIFVKDLGIVLDAARQCTLPLPMAAAAHQLYLQAAAAGLGQEDDSALVKLYPGVTLPAAKVDDAS